MRKQDRIARDHEQDRADQQPEPRSQPQPREQERMKGSDSAEQALERKSGKLPLPD